MKLFNVFFKRKPKALNKAIEHGLSDNQGKEHTDQKANLISDISFIYCLVGNIVEERYSMREQKTFIGTKHFSPCTKVYCFPPQWGDGYEKIKVIGKRRHSHRLITVIIASKYVTNWREKAVYKPFILKQMHQNARLHSTEDHKESLLSLAASLNHK